MRVSMVPFRGKTEILAMVSAKKNISEEEKDIANKAIAVHEATITQSSDGDYCGKKEEQLMMDFLTALANAKKPSKFTFNVAIDTISSALAGCGGTQNRYYKDIQNLAIEHARAAFDVTKADVLRNLDKITAERICY